MLLQKSIAALILLFSASFAQAQDGSTHARLSNTENALLPEGWRPFFGLSTGYMTQGGRLELEGVPTSFKVLGSYYLPSADWVVDFGGGILHQGMANGRNPTVPMVEASARYVFADGWQLGPVVNTLLADSNRFGSANTNFTSFIGASLNRDFTWNNLPLRAGLSAMTDIDIRAEQVGLIVANLQMTFGGSREPAVAEVVPAPATHLIRAAAEPPPQKPLANFALQSSKLNEMDKAYLRRVASLLRMNDSQYEKVTLVGHTDSTGPGRLNQKLSLERARSVREYLASQGVNINKIAVAGRASLDPISQELDPNRRVEIRFSSGVPVTLEKSLRSIE